MTEISLACSKPQSIRVFIVKTRLLVTQIADADADFHRLETGDVGNPTQEIASCKDDFNR